MNLQAHALKASADDACALMKALANPHRLMIARALVDTLSRKFCAVPDRAPA